MIPFPAKKYRVIYADPPWLFSTWSAKGRDRSADKHYPVMTLADIKALPVGDICEDDCALLLWTTWPHLRQALEVIEAWGFTYKTCGFLWAKTNQDGSLFTGLGFWTRANTEPCLLATRGTPTRWSKDVSQFIMAPRGRHSAKPLEIRDRITRLLPGPCIELFARERADGWDVWGDEV